jgi:addiction module RelB/DinJ family antitoxin
VFVFDTGIVRMRIDLRRKLRAEAIPNKLGITPTQAVKMFYAQIELCKAIPL